MGADKSISEEGSGRLSWGVGQCLDPPLLRTGRLCHKESLWTVREACVLTGNFSSDLQTLPAGLLRLAVLAGITLHICILMLVDFTA